MLVATEKKTRKCYYCDSVLVENAACNVAHTSSQDGEESMCVCLCVCVCVWEGDVLWKAHSEGGGRTYFDGDKRVSEIRESLWVSLFFSKIVF